MSEVRGCGDACCRSNQSGGRIGPPAPIIGTVLASLSTSGGVALPLPPLLLPSLLPPLLLLLLLLEAVTSALDAA